MNGIAEAPVRPKNTHAPANPGAAPRVSPGSDGSQPAAEPPDATQDETQNLIQQALKILESTLVDMERIADDTWVNGAHSKVVAAKDIACAMVNPDQVDFVPDTAWGLQQINEHLRPLSGLLCQATGKAVPVAASLAALVDFAAQYSERLHAAICSFPAALEDLRQLTTVGGAKPYRDRPTPPIRRAAPEPDYQDGYTRAQLWCFMEQVAGNLATLNETLMMAQCCDEDWQRDRLLNAAQVMAQSIGCVADHAVGESILGGVGRWHCGPNFPQTGGAE